MSKLELEFYRLASGLRLRSRRMGDDGPTVLLLHGWPQTGYAWRRILPTLAASGYVAYAPDLRGCGDSDKPVGGYEARTRMEDVREMLALVGLTDAPLFVVGHGDEGAAVASAYASVHPEEVAGLALLSALPPEQRGMTADWHDGFHRTPDLPELLIGPHLTAYLRHFFHAWTHDPEAISEADLTVYAEALAQPGALRASLAPFRVPHDQTPLSAEVPTLLLLGESDPRFDLAALKESGVEFQSIVRGGHWLPEERPDPVATALLTFFGANL